MIALSNFEAPCWSGQVAGTFSHHRPRPLGPHLPAERQGERRQGTAASIVLLCLHRAEMDRKTTSHGKLPARARGYQWKWSQKVLKMGIWFIWSQNDQFQGFPFPWSRQDAKPIGGKSGHRLDPPRGIGISNEIMRIPHWPNTAIP